jgi:hypothetical protein
MQQIIEAEPNALVTLPKVQMTKTSLLIPENTDFDEWKTIGGQLKNIEGAIQFWVGDWINFGEHKFGDKYLLAMAKTGYTYDYLTRQKYVSAHFVTDAGDLKPLSDNVSPVAFRHEGLSFSHHVEVVSLPPDVANRLLDKAESERLSRQELRSEVKEWREEHATPNPNGHKERPFSLAQETYVISYVDDIMDIKLRTNRLLQETRDPVVRKYYLELGGKVLAEILDLIKKYPEIEL